MEIVSKNEAALIAESKTKLKGVEYIFVDEISMVSSHEFYSICARLSEILNKPDIVFGLYFTLPHRFHMDSTWTP